MRSPASTPMLDCGAPSRLSTTGDQGLIFEGPIALVHPKLIRTHVVGDEEIYPSVVVEVGTNNSESAMRCAANLRTDRDVFKRAVAPVAEQPVRQGIEG